MLESHVEIATREGRMDAFFCRPEEGGPFPAIIFYMDAPGVREELRDMARRLASVGQAVLLPNLYYRRAPAAAIRLDANRIDQDPAAKAEMWSFIESINDNWLIVSDTAGILDFLKRQPEVKGPPFGCVGYCMSGQYVFAVAGAYPKEIAAMASFYGAGLITRRDDSPHLSAKNITSAELYFAFAEIDHYVKDSTIKRLPEILDPLGTPYRIEVYPGTQHGFAFPLRHCYDKAAAERHYERLFALYRRALPPPG